jgi:DNA-binding Lrp family transcriptional regulator
MKEVSHQELDRHERAILAALQANGRLTNQELADRVGLSASPCWRRVKALETQGYIRRYTALLERRKLGLQECYFTLVTLHRHDGDAVEEFEAEMLRHPEVLECHAITGDGDYLLKVLAESNSAYHRFMETTILPMKCIAHIRTTISLREVKADTAIPVGA